MGLDLAWAVIARHRSRPFYFFPIENRLHFSQTFYIFKCKSAVRVCALLVVAAIFAYANSTGCNLRKSIMSMQDIKIIRIEKPEAINFMIG